MDWDSVPAEVWLRTQLLYVCSPGNPTGAVMPLDEWRKLFELSDRHGFVIASDECYSEIYFRDEPPLGGMQAAAALGRPDFRNLVAFTSLSKRSNVPGMRSGFVAGDAALMKKFLLYRTYHGSAMSPVVQAASIAAWSDERHVVENRDLYRQKFAEVTPLLAERPGRETARRGFLPVGRRAGKRHGVRPRPAGSIQCHRVAGQLPRAREGGDPGPAASAWRWSRRLRNAWRPRDASCQFVSNVEVNP